MPAASARGGNTGSATDAGKASITKSRRGRAKPMAAATNVSSPANFTAFITQDSHFSDEPTFYLFGFLRKSRVVPEFKMRFKCGRNLCQIKQVVPTDTSAACKTSNPNTAPFSFIM